MTASRSRRGACIAVICWPAVKGIGDDKRYFPSCSSKQPICYPAPAQCRGNPSRTRSLLPEIPGNTPQTILPTHRSTRFFPACLFVIFLFIAPENSACDLKVAGGSAFKVVRNFSYYFNPSIAMLALIQRCTWLRMASWGQAHGTGKLTKAVSVLQQRPSNVHWETWTEENRAPRVAG